MKLTQVLLKQHLERMARRHWFIQGKKVITETKAEQRVKENGFEVVDGIETFVKPKHEKLNIDRKLLLEVPQSKDETHPDYKAEPCFIFGDNNVLLSGTKQAQVLTNTVISSESLPSQILKLKDRHNIPEEFHRRLEKNILLSCVFDPEQKKLPKKKDPLRPAWNFPRDYGITDVRKNTLLCLHLASLCELYQSARDLSRVNNAKFSYSTKAHGKLLKFELSAEVLFMSRKQLAPPSGKIMEALPIIHPIHCTVSIVKHHFYETTNLYPTHVNASWPYIHTALLHLNSTQVKNLYGTEVTADQIAGRLLIKAFNMAASQAVALEQGELKEPITVQVIQTDGKNFQFGVFQLNTLDLESSTGKRNVFWMSPSTSLYNQCSYVNGRPVLEGYNPDILRTLFAFTANH